MRHDDLQVRLLVEWAEVLATKLPVVLLQCGLHPRIFASRSMLAACAAIGALVAAHPGGAAHTVLLLLWWLAMLAAVVMIALVHLRWRRLNPPAQPAAPESWVPWIAEQLSRGVPEATVREEMVRRLPFNCGGSDGVSVDAMLRTAHKMLRAEREREALA